MSKYLYGIIIILFTCTFLHATDSNKTQTNRIMFEKLKAFKSNGKINISQNAKNISSETKRFLKDIKKSMSGQSKNIYQTEIFDENKVKEFFKKKQKKDSRRNTIFYLYSETMPFATIKNLIPQIKKHKEDYPNEQFFIVFNGFPSKQFFQKLRKEYKDEYKDLFSIKVHPFIYKFYNVKEVPAYIYLNCNIGKDFRFKKCDNKDALMVRGDVSLIDFFEILSRKDKKFLELYENIIKVK